MSSLVLSGCLIEELLPAEIGTPEFDALIAALGDPLSEEDDSGGGA